MAHIPRVYSLLFIDSTLSVAQGGSASQKKATGERGYSLYSDQEEERERERQSEEGKRGEK